jgi:two-component system repressor protein LuxO
VGASRTEDVDVRIICATNRNPEREVAEGRFREDLYYRLAVVPLHMPPLRDRGRYRGLAQAFLNRFAGEEAKRFDPLGPDHKAALLSYGWPGNVRELQNVIRRAAVLFGGGGAAARAARDCPQRAALPTAPHAVDTQPPQHALAGPWPG